MPYRKSKPLGNIKPPLGSPVDYSAGFFSQMEEFYPFNEGVGPPRDILNKSYQATLISSPSWVVGGGLSCSAGSGATIIPKPNYHLSAGAFTLRIIFRPISLTSFDMLFSRYAELINYDEIALAYVSGTIWLYYIGGQSPQTPITPAVSVGQKYDLVLVRESDVSTVHSYVNGILTNTLTGITGTGTDSLAAPGDARYWFGKQHDGFTNGNFIHYYFQEWQRPLNATEVLALYNQPYAGIVSPRRRIISHVAAGAVANPSNYPLSLAGIAGLMDLGIKTQTTIKIV